MQIRLIYFDSLNRNQKNQPNPYLLFVIYKKSVIFADSSTKNHLDKLSNIIPIRLLVYIPISINLLRKHTYIYTRINTSII